MSTLNRAIAISSEAHEGQLYGCEPYVLHPIRVMLRLQGEAERTVAVLHDVLEDCPAWTTMRLYSEGFSEEIIAALVAITRHKGRETYREYIDRLAANPLASAVKLADLAENMDCIKALPADDPKRGLYRRYYAASLRLLTGRWQ